MVLPKNISKDYLIKAIEKIENGKLSIALDT
jgi:hypothetical protein